MPVAEPATDPTARFAQNEIRRLLILAAIAAALLLLIYVVAVRTGWGQRLDAAALEGRTSRPSVLRATDRLLNTISVSSLLLMGTAVVAIAVARRRLHLAVAAAVVVTGANVTSQLLKHVVLGRLDLIGAADPLKGDPTFPSGHTTVALSLAVAFALVVPARQRGAFALVGLGYACLVGTGTVTAGWHRPSDVIGAQLVVVIWAAAGTAALIRWRGASPDRESQGSREWLVNPALAWTGAALLAVGFVGFAVVFVAIRQDRLHAVRLSGAYVAATAAILGSGLVLMASLLAVLGGVTLDPGPSSGSSVRARAAAS